MVQLSNMKSSSAGVVLVTLLLQVLMNCEFTKAAAFPEDAMSGHYLRFSDSPLDEDDILQPYLHRHGPRHPHRYVRECQPIKYGNVTHETKPALNDNSLPLIDVKYFVNQFWNRTTFGHVAYINNAAETVAVLEPGRPGTCSLASGERATVKTSARQKNCIYAVNAGFFNTTNGGCYGNVITDGKLRVNTGGIQNAHFGIRKDGSLYVGYITEEEVTSGEFSQLVGGVLWIVRDGEVYINDSLKAECSDVQETAIFNLLYTLAAYKVYIKKTRRWTEKRRFSDSPLDEDDILQPYLHRHGPRHPHRYVRECQPIKYGNVTHETKPALNDNSLPLIDVKYFVNQFWNRTTFGHVAYINNAAETVAVLEPGRPGTCSLASGERATVKTSARQKNCIYAVNAGFFNTTNGGCYGNVITDGKLRVNTGGIQNAHFGIRKDGSLYVGYITEEEVTSGEFSQLVGGVLWIVRDGEVYINDSLKAECSDVQETGTLLKFVNVLSARTAVGYDARGRAMIVQIDGRTLHRGATLWEFAEFLIRLGMVNAINLDGGGSTTTVINGTVANYPTDRCGEFTCARKVSTAVCVFDPNQQTSGSICIYTFSIFEMVTMVTVAFLLSIRQGGVH
ncbi:uncharacterized protein LOC106175252 [Lingula anatina]|uniref:Uncharacterized protein LOC106175252 n=1 Tax=Lingula anatina TaxID=7574 RepID=A0A1S3JRA0_LINAN|nr:uncharacterized protein LOC106175252 [Lingula anatina]|eukprot:XP_013412616.1 uncharacterized protein LOC106175252 [Lingula anatina]